MILAGAFFLVVFLLLLVAAAFFVTRDQERAAEICGGLAFLSFVLTIVLFVVGRRKKAPAAVKAH
jgi:hypothetical protein